MCFIDCLVFPGETDRCISSLSDALQLTTVDDLMEVGLPLEDAAKIICELSAMKNDA